MKPGSDRAVFLGIGIAVLMHLLFFAAVRPRDAAAMRGVRVAPETRYLVQAAQRFPTSGSEVRTIKSPIVFSLPSSMGFSRELQESDVRTPLYFSKPVPSERFLEVDVAAMDASGPLAPRELMLTAGATAAPALPSGIFQTPDDRPAARRVRLAPRLKERLEGGVVLPTELNQPPAAPWEVRAQVSVSGQGVVEHVFLDQPLESAPLNQKVLQLLYSLRFKPGDTLDGSIEIYSPEAAAVDEGSTP